MACDTIQSTFLKTAERYRDKTAFNYFDQTWKTVTYSEFLADSKGIASYLIKTGINKADCVAIISENRPEWCISYMGVIMAGAIAVPIDSQLNPEGIRNLLIDSEAKVVFCSSKTEQNVKEAAAELGIKKVNFDSTEFKEIYKAEETAHYPETNSEDIASLIYTSGTTGTPKGVMLTHRNFCSDAEAAIKANVISGEDSVLSILPLHHTYPFMCTFLVPVFLGATTTYSPSLKGTDIIASIKDNGLTILIGVPQILELIRNGIINRLRQLPFPLSWIMNNILKLCGILRRKTGANPAKIFFKSAHKALGRQFRFFGSGGARLEPSVMKDLEAIGFTVLEGYGLTETSPVVTFNPIKKRKMGSVGKPFPSVEIKIIDTISREALGALEEGEIAIKGPMVMKGYYKNPDATAQAIKDGWFFSGDLGYIDEDGYLFITGRIKEVIVLSSGKNIYPEEIEKEYLKIPMIKEICIFGSEEKGKEELLHAIVVPDLDYAKQHRIGNINEALRWEMTRISSKLPSYQRIKGFTLYPEPLPRTPLGKLRRFMIKDLIKVKSEKLKVKSEDEILMADDTGRRIVECISPLLKEPSPVQAKDNLELDLGLDSLQRIELVVSLEKEFSIKLPDTFASDVQTVGELVEKMKEWVVSGQQLEVESEKIGKGLLAVFLQEPSDKEKKGIGLKQSFIEWLFALFLMGIDKLLFKIFFRLDVKGIENIPDKPFIISSNHCSNLDGFAIGAGVPIGVFSSLYFQGFQKYFSSRPAIFFARLAHVIPIDPDAYLSKALQLSGYVLKNNKSLCIFPEGGRSFDGEIMEFKKGIGILALGLNVPVVPALIQGSFAALPKGSYWPRFKKIIVTFGKPFHPSDLDVARKPDGIDEYQFFAGELRQRVRELSNT